MRFRAKIVILGLLVLAGVGAALFVAYARSAKQEHIDNYTARARSVILTAEAVRELEGQKWASGIFNAAQMRTWADEGARDKLLAAVPVVSAWRAAMAKAESGGYTVKVPKFEPRNPANQPDAIEARVLKLFESTAAEEHVEIDSEKNQIRYFRPIRLTQECLLCHGDPKTSATLWGNTRGVDPTGGPMENWKVGEVHGAFEIVQSLDEADAATAASVRQGGLLMAGLMVVGGLVFFFGVPAIIARDVVKPIAAIVTSLTNGMNEVSAVSHQMASTSQSLARGATDQAAALEETAASMEEMSSMTRRNADTSQRVTALMTEVAGHVDRSNQALTEMQATMHGIQQSSGRISHIIKTIDEIAFQTNILALNAAVEAARAGDAGMGFAVVADEVRTLAQRSASAANDTTGLIEDATRNAADGMARLQNVAAVFTDITRSVGQVSTLVTEVSEASQQQSDGISQVSKALAQMEQSTQATAANAEEGAAASEELSAQAACSQALVNDLHRLVQPERAASDTTGRSASPPLARSDAPRKLAA